ncbi:hypothetical protein FACS1894184_07780 [Clostridia bacterium]|nr:hypothetical protein FACS1894184_07780 [Clostridia bacterium]
MDEAGLIALATDTTNTSYKLGNSIAVNTSPWTPIDRPTGDAILFDGQNFTISGLTRPLFRALPAGSTIQDVSLTVSIEIRSTDNNPPLNAGACICETDSGNILGVQVSGSINSFLDNASVGGVVGNNNNSVIANCVNRATVISRYRGGGIVGTNNFDIKSCANWAEIAVGGVTVANAFGGIVGYSSGGSIGYSDHGCSNFGHIACATTNSVGAAKVNYVGGIAGYSVKAVGATDATVSQCINAGAVDGGFYVGGIVGYSDHVDNCTVMAVNISGVDWVAGICGYTSTEGSIYDNTCSATKITAVDMLARIANIAQGANDTNFFTRNYCTQTTSLTGKMVAGTCSSLFQLSCDDILCNGDFASYTVNTNGYPPDISSSNTRYCFSKKLGANMRNGADITGTTFDNTRIIYFDKQNGELNTTLETDSDGNLAAFPTPDPTLPPPLTDITKFEGWYDAPVGGNKIIAPTTFTTNKTLYAHYSCKNGTAYNPYLRTCDVPQKTVTLVVPPCVGSISTVQTDFNGRINPPDPTAPANTEFAGWVYSNQEPWYETDTFASSATLTATFSCLTSGEVFDTSNCTCYEPRYVYLHESPDAQGVWKVVPTRENGTLPKPAAPTPAPDGMTFGNWYLDQDCETPWSSGTVFTSGQSLYACWIPIGGGGGGGDGGGGTGGGGEEKTDCYVTFEDPENTPPEDQQFLCGKTYAPMQPDDPTSPYHTFLGWYTIDGKKWDFFDDATTKDLKLYARWSCGVGFTKPNHYNPCVFNSAGNCPECYYKDGTGDDTHCVPIPHTVTIDGVPKQVDCGSTIPQPEEPDSIVNGNFKGWCNAATMKPIDWSKPITGAVNIIPCYDCALGYQYVYNTGTNTPNCVWMGSCPPPYMDNGVIGNNQCGIPVRVVDGTGESYTEIIIPGDTLDQPPDPEIPGARFIGWYAEPNASGSRALDADATLPNSAGNLTATPRAADDLAALLRAAAGNLTASPRAAAGNLTAFDFSRRVYRPFTLYAMFACTDNNKEYNPYFEECRCLAGMVDDGNGGCAPIGGGSGGSGGGGGGAVDRCCNLSANVIGDLEGIVRSASAATEVSESILQALTVSLMPYLNDPTSPQHRGAFKMLQSMTETVGSVNQSINGELCCILNTLCKKCDVTPTPPAP